MTNSRYGRGLILAITTPKSLKVKDREIFLSYDFLSHAGMVSGAFILFALVMAALALSG